MTERPRDWEAIGDLDWVALPYGCFGLVRRTAVTRNKAVWSWLVLIPWATPTAKAWIDGTYLFEGEPLPGETTQREEVLGHIRGHLDSLYGETVGEAAVDRLLREMGMEDGES